MWLRQDVLALAGPSLSIRRDLFDFIVAELGWREQEDVRRIRPVRIALQNQRDDLLAFAGVLDDILMAIAQTHALPEHLERAAAQAEYIARVLARMEPATRPNERKISHRI